MEKEIWKNIKGYEGYYQVSNLGRVRSLTRTVSNGYGPEEAVRTVQGRILKILHHKNKGYCTVVLCVKHIQKNFSVHRLVAEAFCPNPDNLTEVNHIDEDKNNNRADNLEWCTKKYNSNYGTCVERRLSTLKKRKADTG